MRRPEHPRYPFTVPVAPGGAPDLAAVAAALRTYGLAHLPAALPPDEVAALGRTCDRLLDDPPPGAEPLPYGNGRGWRAERAALATAAPGLVATFDRSWMAAVADAFFGGRPHLLNHDVIAVRDVVGTRHAAHRPHYDRMPNLKQFLYLTDTTAQTGALECRPGSHTFAHEAQAANRAAGTLPAQDDTRVLPPDLTGTSPVEGPAGTLLVIDSDVVHRAGTVRRGHRLAVRSRSYEPVYLSRWG